MPGKGDETFGARLRRYREAAGLTQEELARRAGLSANAVGQLERGLRRHPYPHTVRSLADALGVSEEERSTLLASAPRRGASAPSILTAVPGLPIPPTQLVGRDADAAAVLSALEGDASRLLTLTGPGGVGKTRLALEVASGAGDLFPDGVAFVALGPISDPDLLVPTVAQALGLREAGGKPVRELVQGYLANKRLLLVLDNFEHLLGATPEIAGLLASCPSLEILATSRAPLRLRGEQEYPVDPLPVPDLRRIPEVGDIEDVPSVRLLVERAAEVSPGFGLTRQNAAAVAAICRRLDGLPLAIELVAVRLRLLPPTALLARLDEALPLLTGGPRDLPKRQRTMRDTVTWSHNLLSAGEQVLFRRLSVFAGGFELAAAEAVGGEPVLEGLQALLENSLVRADPEAARGVEPRFMMLQTIRAFGVERLAASDEEAELRGLHADYYLTLAEHATPELEGGGQVAWLERLQAELANLREALLWLLEHGQAEGAARLVSATWLFWVVRGRAGEGQMWLERALASGELAGGDRARTLGAISLLLLARGEIGRMSELVEEAIAEARAAGDEQTLTFLMVQRGYAATFRGDLDAAEEVLSGTLAVLRERGGRWGTAPVLNALAQVALLRGNFSRAKDLLHEGETALRQTEDAFTLATNLNIQATISQLEGEDERTETLYLESVRLSAALRDTWALVYGLVGMAGVAARRSDPGRAARLFGAVEALGEAASVTVAFPPAQALYEQDLAIVRARLDADAFSEFWAEGRALTMDEAVAEALAENTQAPRG